MELNHTLHDITPLELCEDLHSFTQSRPLPRQMPQHNAGYPQLAGSLISTMLEQESKIQVVLTMGEGANFRTGILLSEPPLPRIFISSPVHSHLGFVSSRAPSFPVTPELKGEATTVIALPGERVLRRHPTRSHQ